MFSGLEMYCNERIVFALIVEGLLAADMPPLNVKTRRSLSKFDKSLFVSLGSKQS